MKTIGKTKKYVLPAADMKNKTAPLGFTRFFRFAGLLPIGAGSVKRNNNFKGPSQADFFKSIIIYYAPFDGKYIYFWRSKSL